MSLPFTKKGSATLALAISTAVLSANQALAEQLDSTTQIANAKVEQRLDPLVVVGETTNTVITSEELDKFQAHDLADIFRHVPSVSVGGSLGIAQKVYIRGLEDTQLNVSVDGAQQTGTSFHHTGRVSIDPELLKKVEVQAGAGEATSGFGAIGGSIRFTTKDAEDLLAPGEQFGALIKGSVFSNEANRGSATLFGKLSDDVGFLASFVDTENHDFKDGHGDKAESTASDQSLGFLKLTSRLGDHHELRVSYEERKEDGDFAQRPNWPVASWSQEYPMKTDRETITLNHKYALSNLVNIETTLYRTEKDLEQNVIGRWGKFGANIETYGFDIRNTSWFGNHEVIYGAEYRNDTVESECRDTLAVCGSSTKEKEEGDVYGFYIQDHWQLRDDLVMSYGLRYDDYQLEQKGSGNSSTDSSGVSPNIGFKYDVNDNVQLSIGHARAMRGKEISDGFTLGGTIEPGLDPEKVDNTEVGIEYLGTNLEMKASAYYSTIDDVIVDQLGAGTVYENAGKIKTKGFELQAAYHWDKLMMSASFSHNDARLNGDRVEGYEHNGLANSRGDTWNLAAHYEYSPKLQFGWNFTYVDSLDLEVFQRATEIGWSTSTVDVKKPSYAVHDLYLTWTPMTDESLTIDFAVQNLFDEHYIDHSSVGDYNDIPGWEGVSGQPERGRDFRLTAKYRF